jgi:thiosulfate/3-mercaptopyruvate sulfurtransferase
MALRLNLLRVLALCSLSAVTLPTQETRSSFVPALALPSDPWNPGQTVLAADFAKELQQKHDSSLQILYVGVHTLYAGAHIPGAVFHGPGSTEQGLADLKKYADSLPKNSNVVLYCGCCPLDRCPNLRPAFTALHDHGFARLRVLVLPTSFAADWIEKGYPIEKDQ